MSNLSDLGAFVCNLDSGVRRNDGPPLERTFYKVAAMLLKLMTMDQDLFRMYREGNGEKM